jgi:Dyp-type peroxidase family
VNSLNADVTDIVPRGVDGHFIHKTEGDQPTGEWLSYPCSITTNRARAKRSKHLAERLRARIDRNEQILRATKGKTHALYPILGTTSNGIDRSGLIDQFDTNGRESMRKELIIKSKSLGGTTDLTLFAPIKKGLVPSLDAVTYKTRAKRLLKALNMGRQSSHEYLMIRPFSDAVERTARIHSVRVLIVEPEDKIMLAVTFDGGWESYLRVLWQKVGPLLDVIFCNTVDADGRDYPTAHSNSFQVWAEWVRRVQAETNFFYGAPGLTVSDVSYLRDAELHSRQDSWNRDRELQSSRLAIRTAESRAQAVALGISPDGALASDWVYRMLQVSKIAVQSIVGLHALTSLYLPNDTKGNLSADGEILRRAAVYLLRELVGAPESLAAKSQGTIDTLRDLAEPRFREQLDWVLDYAERTPRAMPVLPERRGDVDLLIDRAQIQKGILTDLGAVSCGTLLFVGFAEPEGVVKFMDALRKVITTESGFDRAKCSVAVSFTLEGLRRIGLSEAELEAFPEEFREGMESRSSILGDVRINHPRRWQFPVSPAQGQQGATPLLDFSSVHCLVDVRGPAIVSDYQAEHARAVGDVQGLVDQIQALPGGARVLARQDMERLLKANGGGWEFREHFGYVDGSSQPTIYPPVDDASGARVPAVYRNQIHVGDILCGYANGADGGANYGVSDQFIRGGTFLVIRKLQQDVEAFNAVLNRAEDRRRGLTRDLIAAKLVGRGRDGVATVTGRPDNDFTYEGDATGAKCPFHAHIRRLNPRVEVSDPPGARIPRIVRRGMSYGPIYDAKDSASGRVERGLVFMAYCSSIAEQFEVIQRWATGGNSSGGVSWVPDPLLGVPDRDIARVFRFEYDSKGKTFMAHVDLDGPTHPDNGRLPLVRLRWGSYLFTPSLPGYDALTRRAQSRSTAVPWDANRGMREIRRIQELELSGSLDDRQCIEEWKSVLEDVDANDRYLTNSIWAAIRSLKGGVLPTKYGVLVCDPELVMNLLSDDGGVVSVGGYVPRMDASIGHIYLGADPSTRRDCDQAVVEIINSAISMLDEQDAFDESAKAVEEFFRVRMFHESQITTSIASKLDVKNPNLEFAFQFREIIDWVLESLCRKWFGIPSQSSKSGANVVGGGFRYDWNKTQPPNCPGHFMAPSRYIFQPHPSDAVADYGRAHGEALTQSIHGLLCEAPPGPEAEALINAPITIKIIDAMRQRFGENVEEQRKQAARAIVGAIMGMVPTVDGTLKSIANEWRKDRAFSAVRLKALSVEAKGRSVDYQAAANAILPEVIKAMRTCPVPSTVWRTATQEFSLGSAESPVKVKKDDVIVLSLASAMQSGITEPIAMDDVLDPNFGGARLSGSGRNVGAHACPGRRAAMGIVIGTLYALAARSGELRESPGSLAFVIV